VKVKVEWQNRRVTRGYGQYCGLAQALDLIGGRWALLVVRDLLTGPKRFSELQEGLPRIPSNVLTSRLRELEEAGIVERRVQAHPGGGVAYALTEYGTELEEPVLRLGFWGAKSMGAPCEGDHVSMDSLALALRGSFRPREAKGPPRLYELRVDGKPLRILVERGRLTAPSQSTEDPDLVVDTEPGAISGLLTGELPLDDAIASRRVHVEGDRAEAQRFVEMFRFPSPDDAKV